MYDKSRRNGALIDESGKMKTFRGVLLPNDMRYVFTELPEFFYRGDKHGCAWGKLYSPQGAVNLAEKILGVYERPELARAFAQEIIRELPEQFWRLDAETIKRWLRRYRE